MLLKIGNLPIKVNSFHDASRTWNEYEANEASNGRGGARKMPHVKLYDDSNLLIGTVSYNGRVWDLHHNELKDF